MERTITDLAPFAVKNDGSEDFKTYVLEPLNKIEEKRHWYVFKDNPNWYYGFNKVSIPTSWPTAPDLPILSVQQVKDYLLGERVGDYEIQITFTCKDKEHYERIMAAIKEIPNSTIKSVTTKP